MRLKITAKNKTTQKSALTSAKPQRAILAAGVEAAEKAIERELRTAGFPMEMDDLKEYVMLSHKGISSEVFDRAFNKLKEAGRIFTNREDIVLLTSSAKLQTGVVQGHRDGFGFLICEEDVPDMYISPEEMTKVLPGDIVVAREAGTDYRGRVLADIVELADRKLKRIVGRFELRRGVGIVVPEDARICKTILIAPGRSLGATPSQIVVAELEDKGLLTNSPVGHVVEILGTIDEPGMETEIAVRKFDLPYKFSEETKKEIKRFSDSVTKSDLRDRVDLRDIPFVTIDGADAKDFDDAVYCLPVEEGKFRLLVAIADVSHYVKPGCSIDKDAQLRTTSVYFPRRVIPMLPEELSNGLCSLNPQVDRCTMVCDAIIGANGLVEAYQFYPAVIRSAARLIYDNVWAALCNPNGPEAKVMEHVLGNVQDLYDLYKNLIKSRELRGAMDFETVETYIVANEQGKIEQILPRERNDAHRLIEEMMLVANTCAADFLQKNKAPCLYRVHEPPSQDRLEKARATLAPFGVTLPGGDSPTPGDYAKVLESIADRPDKAMIQTILLRSMQQAVYSPHNVGHFGLAYDAYTHFTSPIRRYPDLLVHRAIRGILRRRKYVPKILVEPNEADVPVQTREIICKAKPDDKKKVAHIDLWEKLGLLCSAHERRADEASYDVMAWLKCNYMQKKLGQVFKGVISGVSPFAIFVTLEDLYVEGAIHISGLGDDYFVFDDKSNEIYGEDSGLRYRLGDELTVKVARCDLDARRIEFALVSKNRQSRPKTEAKRKTVKSSAAPRKPAARKTRKAPSVAKKRS